MVDIDGEQHKVTVTGTVDSDTLIKKLGRSGKHAEIWSPPTPKTFQNHNQQTPGWIKDENKAHNQMYSLIKPQSKPVLGPNLGPEAADDWAYYGYLDSGMDQNVHIDNDDGIMHCDMNPMMGFDENDVGLPSFEHHHHPSYMNMMGNMQAQQCNLPSPMTTPMMNMGMPGMDNPMMNGYIQYVHQPQMVNFTSSPFPKKIGCFGNFNSVPYLPNNKWQWDGQVMMMNGQDI